MQELFLLAAGVIILVYSLLRLKIEKSNQQQLFDLVAEAKLVQHNLLSLLNETRTTIDILVDHAEKAKDIQKKMDLEAQKEDLAKDSKENQTLSEQHAAYPKKISKSDFRKEKVNELWNQGLAIAEIAKLMSMGKGEVELYLNLINKEVQK